MIPDTHLRQAAAWLVTLRDRRDAATRAAFKSWLAESPAHARAMQAVTDTWDAATGPVPARVRARRPVWGTGLAMVAATLVLLLVLPPDWLVWTRTTYEVGRGDNRVVTLEDGSSVRLNAGAAISVAYGLRGRNIIQHRGDASFKVAKESWRPFQVTAGPVQVVATGTEFLVRAGEETRVVLLEGGVDLRDETGRNLTRLAPGQLARLRSGHEPIITRADVESETAWRQGRIIFRKTRLVDAVAGFAAYDDTKVTLAPAVADLAVSGVFAVQDLKPFLTLAAKLHGLSVQQGTDGAIILTPARARVRDSSVKPG